MFVYRQREFNMKCEIVSANSSTNKLEMIENMNYENGLSHGLNICVLFG